MALNETVLSAAIQAAWEAEDNNALQLPLNDAAIAMCNAIAKAVVLHITTSAVVVGTCATPAGAGTILGTVT